MTTLTKLWNVFRRERLNDELQAEFESHVALLEEDERAQGRNAVQARTMARSRFGNPLLYREESVDSLIVQWLDDLWRDVRYGVRQLGANPILTTVLILTLGLGIGATVAIFSVVDAVLLRPLPYAQADRIVIVWETLKNLTNGSAAAGVFKDWTEQNTAFEDTAAGLGTTYNLADADEPERLNGMRVTPGYFRVAAMPPAAGRYFTEQDVKNSERLVVLSELLWRRRFGGDLSLVGRQIRLSGEPYTVVGVAPAAFALTDFRRNVVGGFSGQLWTPLVFTPDQRANYGTHTYRVLAKLKPAVSRDPFQRSMALVTKTSVTPADSAAVLRRAVRSVDPSLPLYAVQTLDQVVMTSTDGRRFNMLLLSLLAATGVSLAVVGIYAVIVYFVTQRTSEIGLRLALGATNRAVVGMVLRQAAMLALVGIGGGIVLAYAVTRTLTGLLFEISPTDPVSYALGVTFLFALALMASALPAVRATRIDPVRSLAGW